MYKALYRTWRPKVFEDIIGQDHITTTLKNQVKSKKIAHSYLFTGSRGIGKTTSSKVFAKAINCLNNKDGNPCGECENCRDFENGTLTDTVEMDAASNNGVDHIRALREEAVYLPVSAKYRVYIIDEAHMLSKGAFNALLKIMEEPPDHVIFILATTELSKVPPTIISRCQRFDFLRVSPTEIKNMLLKIASFEGINLNEDAALNIGIIANGSVRDAISLLDQTSSLGVEVTESLVDRQAGTADRKKIIELAQYIIENDTSGALYLVDELYKLSVDIKNISRGLLLHFRNIMLSKEIKNPKEFVFVSETEWEKVKEQEAKLSLAEILHSIEVLFTLQENLTGDAEAKALFEAVILRLTRPNLDSSLSGILSRLSKLEENFSQSRFKTQKEKKEPLPEVRVEQKEEKIKVEEDKKDIGKTQIQETKKEPVKKEESKQEPVSEDEPEELTETENELLLSHRGEEIQEEEILQVDEKLEIWSEILEYLKEKNPPLEATLEGSLAYVKADIILIDAPNTVFFDLMRASEQTKESLRQAIEIKTGRQYRLGPVKKGSTVKKVKNDFLKKLEEVATKQGLEVTK